MEAHFYPKKGKKGKITIQIKMFKKRQNSKIKSQNYDVQLLISYVKIMTNEDTVNIQ